MAQFWLYDGTNTLDLDATVQELKLGGSKRSYKVAPFAGSAGGFIRGFGTVGSKTFSFSRKEKVEGSDITAWNSRRNDLASWALRSRTENIYLRIRDGENSFTVQTLIYFTEIGVDKYKNYRITDMKEYKMISPKGVLENIVATTGSQAVVEGDNTVTVVNSGIMECPIKCKFTPTGIESKFGTRIADQFGFVLEKLYFSSGLQIVYDTADNRLTIDGESQKVTQFLSSGSVFMLPPGSTDLLVNVSGPGTFAYEFNTRFV